MYIKKRYRKSFLKISISFFILLIFSYIIIYADKFEIEEINYGVNAAFYEIVDNNVDGSIYLDQNIIVDDSNSKFTYIVQPGDNLSKIAFLFGTTVANIKKVNELNQSNPILRPGQKLIISQEEGIIYEIEKNINFNDFIKKYKFDEKTKESIIELNYYSDENDLLLNKGDEMFIPITDVEAKKLGLRKIIVQKPKPTSSNSTYTPSAVQGSSTYNGTSIIAKRYYSKNIQNGFYLGHCTRYVALKKFPYIDATHQKKLWNGNANRWLANAKAAGYRTGNGPQIGAIVVLKYGGKNYYNYGHVGIVLDVDRSNKKLLIEEMNAAGRFIVTRRRISMDSKIIGYIYL